MSGINRTPDLGTVPDVQRRYAAISKAQWAELYRDLFAITCTKHDGFEDCQETDHFMDDAEERLKTLKANGLAGG
jgi:hypothetical protein